LFSGGKCVKSFVFQATDRIAHRLVEYIVIVQVVAVEEHAPAICCVEFLVAPVLAVRATVVDRNSSRKFNISTTFGGLETVFGFNFSDGRIKGYPRMPAK